MPWQIHWILGNADLRFCVLCPKIYRSQWTGHSHIVGHCHSEGLWGCHALQTFLSAVRQPCWHCSGQVEDAKQRSSLSRNGPLPGGQLLLEWRYLWHTSAMVWWCGCRCEGCCSILTLELGVGFTLVDCFFDGLVYAGPKDTSTCEQLWLHYSLMELMELIQDSLPFSRRNNECFTLQD